MLIHLGQNEFINLNDAELIINLQTIDTESRNRILATIPKQDQETAKAAVLTTSGKWLPSTLSSEALSQRGLCHPFQDASYLCSKWQNTNLAKC